ncbi:MAG: HD domain-containing protein [Desulfuromonadaceae bacterium]|nr:HD domain-containing protein [Desulfuromonadaceae bacterium]MDD2855886.1 HD domain-containing protein [Desulfuromonadaceae bacterium]
MNADIWKERMRQWLENGDFDIILPEVAALRGVPQPPEFHPEGDAFVHTMQAVAEVDDMEDERIFWGVILHDIGKKFTTEFVNGRWRSHGHPEAGAKLVYEILVRLGVETITEDVAWLVKHHHYHHTWNLKTGQELSKNQLKFTEHPLFPLLLKVCSADAAGRKPEPGSLTNQ